METFWQKFIRLFQITRESTGSKWFLIFLFCGLLVFCFDIKIEVDSSQLLSFIGICISSLSFLVCCYFIILGVSAYSHIKDIEKIKIESEIIQKKTSINLEHLKHSTSQAVNSIEEIINLLLFQFSSHFKDNDLREYRNHLLRIRGRLAATSQYMEKERRKTLLSELSLVGDRNDLAMLNSLSVSPYEDEDIKQYIKEIAINIEDRLN